jgi:hypothetical protein
MVMREKCAKLLNAFQRNVITKEELCSNLFDSFIYDGVRNGGKQWGAGLDSLPRAVLLDLLTYAKAHPEPRVFHPVPTDARRKVAEDEAALATQADLLARLDGKCR